MTANATDIHTLEKAGITVNSNIYLNSFMCESILDLTIDHIIMFCNDISRLSINAQTNKAEHE